MKKIILKQFHYILIGFLSILASVIFISSVLFSPLAGAILIIIGVSYLLGRFALNEL